MELLDIVDENGKPTGETVERKTAHSEGIRHRTAHVWIVRKSDEGADLSGRQGDQRIHRVKKPRDSQYDAWIFRRIYRG